ncbi:GNAT family N-acetyltransferase [uncultured Gelidibacter sp.]|uniref:GNAT family N-acetyltransferase n=1 Tax=uncultured Gelidibacter sp. TaxID=259318 RepID=UPI0026324E55|nr:GNAT family N-acetyltransferase [uncultured Gelidibacter sp.]
MQNQSQNQFIRPYALQDEFQVIELLRQNIPASFDPSEEQDFIDYLKNGLEDYFVYDEHSKILGAGGINYLPEEQLARISWDMVDPKMHGKGIGKKLLEFRINHVKNNPNVNMIDVRTSQLAYKYYQKFGFELMHIEKDYWAKNFDLYHMQQRNKIS